MKKQRVFHRSAGILLPIASLPSPYGIGTFGKTAFQFIDFLSKAGQKYWQILPLGPISYGDSPYQSFSSFAGNPYFIDLDILKEEGLLTQQEIVEKNWGEDPEKIDYAAIFKNRFLLLRLAYQRSHHHDMQDYCIFCRENERWLSEYALYMALKNKFCGKEWLKWPEEFRVRQTDALALATKQLQQDIDFWKFCQFKFFKQWEKLRDYAHKKGIQIIGDIPIYTALDSADVWSEPEVFYLGKDLLPIEVAGCPPDAFSETGQLWGNPLYRWNYQRETDFSWWKRRLRATAKWYDVLRIDHFRGLESYYAIPFGQKTAENGVWRKGPGITFFEKTADSLQHTQLILEDLGFLTDKVRQLRHEVGAPGMKVLQFAFDSREESDYLPHNYDKNCVVYTGTHDNDTVMGWVSSANAQDVELAKRYLHVQKESDFAQAFIRAAYGSVAALAIVPIQDFLHLGSEARINTPSTIGENWKWRLQPHALQTPLAQEIYSLTKLFGR